MDSTRRPSHRRPAVVLAAALAPLAAGVLTGCDTGPPTFADDVAPIVYGNCAVCHRDGGPGPFTLLSYEDVSSRAALIADVTGRGYMPPWLPAVTDEPFARRRSLTAEQIETLEEWAGAGAPAGDLAAAPEAPTWPSGWALGEPDMVLEMTDTVEVPAGGTDQFRNFVIPVPVDQTRYVRGMELDPGRSGVVHHAVVSLDATSSSRIADAMAPGPGFPGMLSTSQAQAPGGFFVGWTPGRVPSMNRPGLAWAVEPGNDLVVQLHLRPATEPREVSARVALYFTDEPPQRSPVTIRLGGQTLDIPAGESDYEVTDELTVPVDVEALAIYPHAHFIATSMDVRAELPDGTLKRLLWIPEWDFNWQDAYSYEEPVALPAGTTLRIRYVYDNSADNPANPFDPPRRITYGRKSTDEMAELHLQVLPVREQDLETLQLALAAKAEEAQVEGWRHMLHLDPTDAEAHFGLGTLAQREGHLEEARDRYRRAIAARPDFPQAHYNLGLVREGLGMPAAAMEAYRETLRLFPPHADAHNNLGALQAADGRTAAAEESFRAALAVDSTHAGAHNNLGNVLRERGELEGAMASYRAAQRYREGFTEAEVNLALTLLEAGRADEAVRAIEAAGGGDIRETAEPRLLMAWSLATHPDPERRRPSLSVRLAEDLARLTRNGDPLVLDVLAAGYAAEGDFPPAVGAAERAAALARAAGDPATAATIEARIELYRGGRPYVQAGG